MTWYIVHESYLSLRHKGNIDTYDRGFGREQLTVVHLWLRLVLSLWVRRVLGHKITQLKQIRHKSVTDDHSDFESGANLLYVH